MAKPRFEYCRACKIRALVEERLNVPKVGRPESPKGFWERMEEAGRLSEALALYDKLEVEHRTGAHMRRETKGQFEERIEKEGRQEQAQRLRAELVAQGLLKREVQEKLVETLQPLAGGRTRAWHTPNPWNEGRFCRRKADQDRLLALTGNQPNRRDGEMRRLHWAQHRLEERQALMAARRRAQVIKAMPPKSIARTAEQSPSPPARYVHGQTPIPCGDCGNAFVSPSSPGFNQRLPRCSACYEKAKSFGWV
jgi:hypothetical protein